MTHPCESHLLVRPQTGLGEYVRVTPESAGWEHLSFAARLMHKGVVWSASTDGCEYGLVVLGGQCAVNSSRGAWPRLGRRPEVFHGMPYALYLPRETQFTVIALSPQLDLAYGWCRAEGEHPPRLVMPEQVEI